MSGIDLDALKLNDETNLPSGVGNIVIDESLIDREAEKSLFTKIADRARAFAQGASLATSDEIYGSVKGVLTGEGASAGIQEQREKLAEFKEDNPYEAMAYETGGALGTGLLTAPLTGGASLAPSLGRMAAVGAIEGYIYGVGTSEGAVTDRLASGVDDAIIGSVANPAFQGLFRLTSTAARAGYDASKRKLLGQISRRTEDEIKRITRSTGYSFEDLIDAVGKDQSIAEISPQAAIELKGLYNKSGVGEIVDQLKARNEKLKEIVNDTLLTDLSGSADQNIAMAVKLNDSQVKNLSSNQYKKVFSNHNKDIKPIDLKLNNARLGEETKKILSSSTAEDLKFISDYLRRKPIHRTKGQLFKIVKPKGEEPTFKLLRDVDLETAEEIRRALADMQSKAFREGSGGLGNIFKQAEGDLRVAIDSISPELAFVRKQWSIIKVAQDAFVDGQKLTRTNMDPEDVEIMVQEYLKRGGREAIEALRQGFAKSIKFKLKTKQRESFITSLASKDLNSQMIFRKLYPEDSLEDAIEKITRSSDAIRTLNIVDPRRQSITSVAQASSERVGGESGGGIAAKMGMDYATGGKTAILRGLVNFMQGKIPDLTRDEMTKAADILVSNNSADVVERLQRIERTGIRDLALEKAMERIVRGLGFATTGAIVESDASENLSKYVAPPANASTSLNQIISGASNAEKKKILAASNAR